MSWVTDRVSLFTLTYHEQPPPDLGEKALFFAPEVIRDLLTVPHVYLSDAGSDPSFRVSGQWQAVVVPQRGNRWARLVFEYRLENEAILDAEDSSSDTLSEVAPNYAVFYED